MPLRLPPLPALIAAVCLLGCVPASVVGDDDDSVAGPECTGGGGDSTLQIVTDDASHEPVADGGDLVVERRYQGAIATVVALRWTGVDGGEALGELMAAITTDAGDVVAERHFDEAFAPCEVHGGVGLHEFEVFVAYGGPMPDVDGLAATLEVSTGGLSDQVTGTLRVVDE